MGTRPVSIRGLAAACTVALVAAVVLVGAPAAAAPIPEWFGRDKVPNYIGAPATANPIPGTPAPPHPFMAPQGQNNIHGDSYASDTHPAVGPLGVKPKVVSYSGGAIGGECATHTFDSQGRMITFCATFASFRIVLRDPHTLAELASYQLPSRPSTIEAILTLDLQKIFTDTSGGAYFFLDNEDRVVLVDATQHLLRLKVDDSGPKPVFVKVEDVDLSAWVGGPCTTLPSECDVISAVLPAYDGLLWWVSRKGAIATVDPVTHEVHKLRITPEEIQNSFAVAPDGVYVVSDAAMYKLHADPTGMPVVDWRETYDNTGGSRPGQINAGSGTTPTLVDDGDDRFVAITDNAPGRINILVYHRDTVPAGASRLVCTVPLFGENRSATDNSLVGWGRSFFAENNWGYENFTSLVFGKVTPGGVSRVDVREDDSGCDTIWTSNERVPSTVTKLSVGSGLLYTYTKDPAPYSIDAWYFTAIDARTGATAWKVLTGTGWNFDNLWAATTIGPDGTGYTGVFNGIIAVSDQ